MNSLYDILFGKRAADGQEGTRLDPRVDGSMWQLLQTGLKTGAIGNGGENVPFFSPTGEVWPGYAVESTSDATMPESLGNNGNGEAGRDFRAAKGDSNRTGNVEGSRGEGDPSEATDAVLKFWKPENPDWENVRPEMKKATIAFVGDMKNRFGTDRDPWITSGYRSPTVNDDTKGASKNSWHMKGMAIDMNLEDYTPEEREEIVKLAQNRFGEVLFHDAGTGLHLHIADPLPQSER